MATQRSRAPASHDGSWVDDLILLGRALTALGDAPFNPEDWKAEFTGLRFEPALRWIYDAPSERYEKFLAQEYENAIFPPLIVFSKVLLEGGTEAEANRALAEAVRAFLAQRGRFAFADENLVSALDLLRLREAGSTGDERREARKELDHALRGFHPPSEVTGGAPPKIPRGILPRAFDAVVETLRVLCEKQGRSRKDLLRAIEGEFKVEEDQAWAVAAELLSDRPNFVEAAAVLLSVLCEMSPDYLKRLRSEELKPSQSWLIREYLPQILLAWYACRVMAKVPQVSQPISQPAKEAPREGDLPPWLLGRFDRTRLATHIDRLASESGFRYFLSNAQELRHITRTVLDLLPPLPGMEGMGEPSPDAQP